MIHEAYMPVYRCPDFHCAGAGPPEVVQEALADLKKEGKRFIGIYFSLLDDHIH